jgi:hypothetical protein
MNDTENGNGWQHGEGFEHVKDPFVPKGVPVYTQSELDDSVDAANLQRTAQSFEILEQMRIELLTRIKEDEIQMACKTLRHPRGASLLTPLFVCSQNRMTIARNHTKVATWVANPQIKMLVPVLAMSPSHDPEDATPEPDA